VRVLPLNVAGAFHTPLMQAAAEGMRAVLADAPFTAPRMPVVSNVTAQPMTSAAEFAGELADQVTSPVLWVDDVRTMLGAGVTSFIEFGPGKVLTGALKRTEPSATLRNVGTAAEAQAAE
jgi:[acyl-carrier-protein] S-malonyltransferase